MMFIANAEATGPSVSSFELSIMVSITVHVFVLEFGFKCILYIYMYTLLSATFILWLPM